MKKIAILYGQIRDDAGKDDQDTLVQVAAIARALERLELHPMEIPLSLDLTEALARLKFIEPDIVFNLVETVAGQGRLIHLGPALLDALNLRYTGADTEAMFLTSNKVLAKQTLRYSGIPTPAWHTLLDLRDNARIEAGRYLVKSLWEHASVGLSEDSVIETGDTAELRAFLQQQQSQLGGEGFAEAYIDGREFNLAVLASEDGPRVLPPAEIRFDSYPSGKLRIVDYRAKWEESSFEYHHTPRQFQFHHDDAPLLQTLQDMALRCWRIFGLRGYARVDFRVDTSGAPWVLEVNANPCISPDAGFMAAAAQAGLTVEQVVERILQDT